jgi:cytochrome c oxidase cbb3-type subunit 3
MPAFGGALAQADVKNVVAYLRSLSAPSQHVAQDKVAAGRTVFEANCAACHGENAGGMPEAGAPNLSDSVWLYGGDPRVLYETIARGRQGHMPAWEGRLTNVERKILALYLATLRNDQP